MVRVKRRYVLFSVALSEEAKVKGPLSDRTIVDTLRSSVTDVFGERGSATIGGRELRVISTVPLENLWISRKPALADPMETGIGLSASYFTIVRCARAHTPALRVAATLSRGVSSSERNRQFAGSLAFRTVVVAGTLRSCRRHLLTILRRRAAMYPEQNIQKL